MVDGAGWARRCWVACRCTKRTRVQPLVHEHPRQYSQPCTRIISLFPFPRTAVLSQTSRVRSYGSVLHLYTLAIPIRRPLSSCQQCARIKFRCDRRPNDGLRSFAVVVRVDALSNTLARFTATLRADPQLRLARPLAQHATAFRRTLHRSTASNIAQAASAAVQNGSGSKGKMGRKVVLTLHRNDLR